MLIEVRDKGLTMQEAFDKINGSSDKLGTAIEMAGKRGGQALLIIAQQSLNTESKLAQLTTAFESSDGAAKRMSDTMTDNLTGDFDKLSSAWEGLILGMEDGGGIMNKLGRQAVQLLTSSLGQLSLASEFLGFTFEHLVSSLTDFRLSSAASITDIRTKVILGFRIMALKALEHFADVPLLGKAIDKDGVSAQLKLVEEAYSEHLGKQAKLDEIFAKRKDKRGDFWASWENRKQETVNRIKAASKEKKDKEESEKKAKESEEKIASDEAAAEKRKQFTNKLNKQQEDQDDETELQKIERKRLRHIAELETLGYNKTEKEELERSINEYYKTQADEKQLEDDQAEATKKHEDIALTKEEEELAFEDQRLILSERREAILGDEMLSEEQRLAFLASIKDAEVKIDSKQANHKKKQLDELETLALNASNLAGKRTAAGKGLGIAAAMINTYQGASEALKQPSTLPEPLATASKIANVALTIKTGLDAVKSIASVKVPGGGGGGAAPSISSGGAQPPAINVVGRSTVGEQRIEEAINQGNTKPSRAYIVESDMASNTALQRRVNDVSSMG